MKKTEIVQSKTAILGIIKLEIKPLPPLPPPPPALRLRDELTVKQKHAIFPIILI